MRIHGVLETCLYVDDLEASESFYADILGLDLFSRQPGRHCFFRCGQAMLLLFLADSTLGEDTLPAHGCRGPGHIAFGVPEADLPGWESRLQGAGVEIEFRNDWPRGGRSLYFRDPSGNSLELASPKMWGLEEGA